MTMMKLCWISTAIIVICKLCTPCWAEQEYEAFNEEISSFPGELQTLVHFDDLNTVGRDRALNGTFTFDEDLTEEEFKFTVELFSSPKGDGDWKRLPMGVPHTPVCEGFKKFYVQFVQPSMKFEENTNFPVVEGDGLCPIPKGTYYIQTITFDVESWPQQVPRGILKCVVTFYQNNVPVGGLIVVVKIEDKP